jgi:hypothetical protein
MWLLGVEASILVAKQQTMIMAYVHNSNNQVDATLPKLRHKSKVQ